MNKNNLFFFFAGMLTAFLMLYLPPTANSTNPLGPLSLVNPVNSGDPVTINPAGDKLTIFPEKGDYISRKQFKVFQVLEPTMALASELSHSEKALNIDIYNGITVLLINDKGKHYYDDEIIKISSDKGARQIGTFKYRTKQETYKTVPVVSIE